MIVVAMLVSAETALGHESSSAPPPKKDDGATMPRIVETKKGLMVVDPKGMTLYYDERDDGTRRSACDIKCAAKWIPLAAPDNAQASGDFTVVTRSDGTRMWAYRYRPLYMSRDDQAPGEAHGVDLELFWHVARPE